MKKIQDIEEIILAKKNEIESEIISFMKENNARAVSFFDWEDTPVVEYGYKHTYSLLEMYIEDDGRLVIEGGWGVDTKRFYVADSTRLYVADMDIDVLFDMYNWLLENENKIVNDRCFSYNEEWIYEH